MQQLIAVVVINIYTLPVPAFAWHPPPLINLECAESPLGNDNVCGGLEGGFAFPINVNPITMTHSGHCFNRAG